MKTEMPTDTKSATTIPPILHQTWKTKDVPRRLRRYVRSWSKFQKLTYRFHTDEDLRNLIATHFPEHLEQYDLFSRNIERADFSRYALMSVYGGIYADLDMECIRSIEPLLSSTRAIIGCEPEEHAAHYRVGRVLCNAILFSPPGHPYWRILMDHIAANYQPGGNVVFNTGPMAMTRLHQQRPEVYENVEITEPTLFYPVTDGHFSDRREGRFRHVSRTCRIADAYTVHHWVHTYISRLPMILLRCAIGLGVVAAAAALWYFRR